MLMRAATTFYFNKFDANERTTDIYLSTVGYNGFLSRE